MKCRARYQALRRQLQAAKLAPSHPAHSPAWSLLSQAQSQAQGLALALRRLSPQRLQSLARPPAPRLLRLLPPRWPPPCLPPPASHRAPRHLPCPARLKAQLCLQSLARPPAPRLLRLLPPRWPPPCLPPPASHRAPRHLPCPARLKAQLCRPHLAQPQALRHPQLPARPRNLQLQLPARSRHLLCLPQPAHLQALPLHRPSQGDAKTRHLRPQPLRCATRPKMSSPQRLSTQRLQAAH